jgi:signal transduction histidine kinase
MFSHETEQVTTDVGRTFRRWLDSTLTTKWSALSVAVVAVLWAQGAPLGYVVHHWLFGDSSLGLLSFAASFFREEQRSIIYIWGGTSFFFGLFGFAIGRLLDHIRGYNAELKQLVALKDRYVSVCSHDLKSPLTGIIGYAQLIAASDSASKADREAAAYIGACGQHLLSIINDVLDFSRLQVLEESSEMAPVNLASMVRGVVGIYSNLAARKGLILTCQIDPTTLVNVVGRKIQLERALGNLLSNAIKFTSRGGTIQVSLSKPDPDSVSLQVKDTGIGLPADRVSTILQSSAGLHRKGTEGEESTGIGLEVIKHVARSHQARLQVSSREGLGSCFSLIFPDLTPSAGQIPPRPSQAFPRRRLPSAPLEEKANAHSDR